MEQTEQSTSVLAEITGCEKMSAGPVECDYEYTFMVGEKSMKHKFCFILDGEYALETDLFSGVFLESISERNLSQQRLCLSDDLIGKHVGVVFYPHDPEHIAGFCAG